MKQPLRKHENKLRFALVGGINTALDFGLLFILTSVGVNRYVANFISTTISFIVSFFMNRRFTFKSTASMRRQIIPFTVVTLIGLWALQPAVIWVILHVFSDPDNAVALFIAKCIATVASMTWNYVLYSRFVFKERSS